MVKKQDQNDKGQEVESQKIEANSKVAKNIPKIEKIEQKKSEIPETTPTDPLILPSTDDKTSKINLDQNKEDMQLSTENKKPIKGMNSILPENTDITSLIPEEASLDDVVNAFLSQDSTILSTQSNKINNEANSGFGGSAVKNQVEEKKEVSETVDTEKKTLSLKEELALEQEPPNKLELLVGQVADEIENENEDDKAKKSDNDNDSLE